MDNKSEEKVRKRKGTNRTSNSEKKKMNKMLKISLITLVSIIGVAAILFASLYLFLNIKLYLDLDKEENTSVTFNSYFRYVLINSKVIEKFNEENKNLEIEYNDNIYTIPATNVQRVMDIELNIKEKVIMDFTEIKNIECLYIRNGHYSLVTLKLPEYIKQKELVDVYSLNNDNKLELYKKAIAINENGTIQIEKKDNSKGYIVIYVPLQDIIVENGKEVIEINKGQETNLNVSFIPGNATTTQYKYTTKPDSKVSVNGLGITGNEIGDETITVSSLKDNVSKEIKLHIANYVSDIKFSKDIITLTEGNSYDLSYTIYPEDAENPNISLESSNTNVATIDGARIKAVAAGSCNITARTTEGASFEKSMTVNVVKKVVVTPTINNVQNVTYINGILIVNKTYALPSTYNPGVNATALAAFNEMKAAAANEGLTFWIASGFRSYNTQAGLYNRYVNTYGKESADTFSARPGHSEHQTGLAFDVNYVEDWFANTVEGQWLAANAHKYGFIVRYPAGKQAITGYKYEPWHIRYLGKDIATSVYNSGLCLEEYLGITSKYSN